MRLIALVAICATACTPRAPDAEVTEEKTATPEKTLTAPDDLRRLSPAGRLGYTVIPQPTPDAVMRSRPLLGAERDNRGLACRRPAFTPTRVDATIDGEAVSADTWWFEFTPEGFANVNVPAGKLVERPNPERTKLVGDYRVGYVIYAHGSELRYHPWHSDAIGWPGPVAFGTMLADVRVRLGCEGVDLQWMVAPPRPYRNYAAFGVAEPDAEIRGLPPINTGTGGNLGRRPDFAPTRHAAYGIPGGVDAWFFEYDPKPFPGFGGRFYKSHGTDQYRAGYVVFDVGGELRMHDWSTLPRVSGDPFMYNGWIGDISNRFGAMHLWHN